MQIIEQKGLMECFISISGAPEGRYSGRSQTFYQDGYSDEEGAGTRMPSGDAGSSGGGNRARPVSSSSRDHRRPQSYNHGQEPRRSSHKPSK